MHHYKGNPSKLHRGKLTWHLKIGLPKRKIVFQPSIFRCYVSLREGIIHLYCLILPQNGWHFPKIPPVWGQGRGTNCSRTSGDTFSEVTLLLCAKKRSTHGLRLKEDQCPASIKQTFWSSPETSCLFPQKTKSGAKNKKLDHFCVTPRVFTQRMAKMWPSPVDTFKSDQRCRLRLMFDENRAW